MAEAKTKAMPETPVSVQGFLVRGLPVIKEDDDLASLIESHFELLDGDVICIASTIVAKSEDRFRCLDEYKPSPRQLLRWALQYFVQLETMAREIMKQITLRIQISLHPVHMLQVVVARGLMQQVRPYGMRDQAVQLGAE